MSAAAPGPRVRIVKIVCAERHFVVGCAYKSEDGAEDSIYQWQMRESYLRMGGQLKCGICGSTTLTLEDSISDFRTVDEAVAIIGGEQAAFEQLRARKAIDSARRRAVLN